METYLNSQSNMTTVVCMFVFYKSNNTELKWHIKQLLTGVGGETDLVSIIFSSRKANKSSVLVCSVHRNLVNNMEQVFNANVDRFMTHRQRFVHEEWDLSPFELVIFRTTHCYQFGHF